MASQWLDIRLVGWRRKPKAKGEWGLVLRLGKYGGACLGWRVL